MDPVRTFLSQLSGSSVLDLACGDGWFTERLCENLSGCKRVIGVDIDGRELVDARDMWDHRYPVRFELGTAMDLRFGCGSFDIVAVSNALHHIPNPGRALAEARRVLKPGGAVVVHEMTSEVAGRDRENARDFHHLKAQVDRLLGIPHQETLSEAQTLALLEGAELEVRRIDRYDPPPQTESEAIEARIEFLRDYITHVMERNEFASIRKRATLLAERIRVNGFAPAPQLLIEASAPA